MPKIIKNAKDVIIQAAKEELKENPSAFSMRNVAKKTSIAVGTIYHYFPDKLTLVANILAEEWIALYQDRKIMMEEVKDKEEMIQIIHDLVRDYKDKFQKIYLSYRGKEGALDYAKLHKKFVYQLRDLLQVGIKKLGIAIDMERDAVIIEMILSEIRDSGIQYETLSEMIAKLI